MSNAAQIIEWVFSSPFLWMTLLGVVTAHSMRRRMIRISLPYAPLFEEKNENRLGARMLFAFILSVAGSLFIYFTDSALNFAYSIGIWFVAFILMVKGKEPTAFLFAALILGIVSFFADGAASAYKMLRYTGLYQLIMGILYLVGKKETYPLMQQDKEGKVHGAHIYRESWLLPAAALSLWDSPLKAVSYVMIVMLLFSDVTIKRTTPEKYFKRHGIFMAVTGAALSALSLAQNEIVSAAGLFAAVPAALIYWLITEARFRKRKGYFYVADDTGVKVLFVYEDTPANTMGLKTGDLITSINGRRVVSPEAVDAFLEDRPPFIWLEILRDGKTLEQEYKDYEQGIGDLGIVYTPKHPSKYELYPHPGFFSRTFKKMFSSLKNR